MPEREKSFKRLMNQIGCIMIIFVVIKTVFDIIWVALYERVLVATLVPVAAEVASQLIYGFFYLAAFMIPAFILRGMRKKEYRPIMLSPRLPRESALYIFATIAVCFAFAYINSMLLSVFNYDQFTEEMLFNENVSSNYQVVLMIITTAIVPAFCEEFLFRGAILSNIRPYGKMPAVLISALLFALMHQNSGQLLYTFAAGILLGWVTVESGSIYCGTIIHFVNNFIAVAETVMAERIKDNIIFSPAIYLLETVILLVGLVCIVILIVKKTQKDKPRDFADGVFGCTLPIREQTVSAIAPTRVARLFFAPVMVVFVCISALSAGFLILMSLFL